MRAPVSFAYKICSLVGLVVRQNDAYVVPPRLEQINQSDGLSLLPCSCSYTVLDIFVP
jgi:hypothetical protein